MTGFDLWYSGFHDGEYKYLFQQLRRPMNDEPIDHPLRTAVMEAIGAGSTCWESGTNTGNAVFDMARATEIGNGLLATFAERETELTTAATQAMARCHAYLILLTEARAMLRDVANNYMPGAAPFAAEDWLERFRAVLAYPPLIDINQLTLDVVEPGS